MKKAIAYILCLVLLFGCAHAEELIPFNAYVQQNFDEADVQSENAPEAQAPGVRLGMQLLSMMHVSGENTLLSPQSLAMALGMAAEGARGETLDELLAALEVESLDAIVAQPIDELKSANALFSAPGIRLNTEYLNRLQEGYAAEGFMMDAAVVEKVNDWVKENTDGLIEQLLQEAPGKEIGLMLVNALAMDARWAAPFSPSATETELFHALSGDIEVQMMHQTAMFDYAEEDGMQVVRLPYMDSSLEMWIVLPAQGGMFPLLERLAEEGTGWLMQDAQMREVALGLPRMDISADASLSRALQLLGVEAAFGMEADFSGISDTPLCIDQVLQKVRVQVDEDGTKAAAATMLMMKAMAAFHEVPPVEMVVNRPFVFVISDRETGAVCFAGAVENPAEN